MGKIFWLFVIGILLVFSFIPPSSNFVVCLNENLQEILQFFSKFLQNLMKLLISEHFPLVIDEIPHHLTKFKENIIITNCQNLFIFQIYL